MSLSLPLRLGTRGSPLARLQTDLVRAALAAAHPELQAEGALEVVVIRTTGDQVTDRPLAAIGGKGLFCKEIEAALFDRRIDLGVHSMKDLPTWLPDGLTIAAMLPRADPRDVLISRARAGLDGLPEGAVVGTASLRRQAQLLARRPDLKVVNFRGNVGTRLAKLEAGEVDATLLARAGIDRLGLDVPHVVLAPEEMLPAVGQGAIGLECRADDAPLIACLAAVDHAPTSLCVAAERAMLDVLDGTCHTPIGAFAELADGRIRLRGLVARADGRRCVATERAGPAADALDLARDAGRELRASAGPDWFA
jgi:hydroxymethylbilane synthase